MSIVYPSINCHLGDDECVREKAKRVAQIAKRVHVDVADGIFTPHKTWNDPANWKNLARLRPGSGGQAGDIEFEVHLMTEDPAAHANLWLSAGAARLIVHAETIPAPAFGELEALCRRSGVELMLSSNPETKVAMLEPYFPFTNLFQALAVHPGLSGQKFLPVALEKIAYLRAEIPGAVIEADGGVIPETARAAARAGANEFVAGEYIFSSPDPRKAYEELVSLSA